MSKSVSGLDWKDLIMPYAEIIGYSQKDNNYPFIAQAYVNAGHDVNGFKKIYAINLKAVKPLNFIA